ncbi:MAG: DUF5724 domain-containing protein [Eubacteriales bacterium]|nr:DUF5724 domain-containing protein [Eubacteriales bacterium]
MQTSELVRKLRNYNQTLFRLTSVEQGFMDVVEKQNYFFRFWFPDILIPDTLEELLKQQNSFRGLLPKQYDKLCEYLRHIQQFTCNMGTVRMDVRSSKLSNYRERVFDAIGVFYIFYGAELSVQKLIYGEYKEHFRYLNMAPVIALEIFRKNEQVIQYCKEVLTSENNVGFLTTDLIVAIEQSENQELQDLLTNLFLAAKLQEGVRQSILETADEYQIHYFYRMVDVIWKEKLLRYSSVRRSVLTWIGIGYEEAEQRLAEMIFHTIYAYIHDEKLRRDGLKDENPLKVYLALYCMGIKSMEEAIEEAVVLLEHGERHIIAAALIYLQLTNHFPIMKYQYLLEQYKEDSWITALYLSECIEKNDIKQMTLSKEECHRLYDLIYSFLENRKAQQTYSAKGFEWFSVILYKQSVLDFLAQLLIKAPEMKRVELLIPYLFSLSPSLIKEFLNTCFSYAPLAVWKKAMIKEIILQQKQISRLIMEALIQIPLEREDIMALEGRLKTKKSYARAAIIQVLSKQSKECVRESFERLYRSEDKLIHESAIELQRLTPEYFEAAIQPKIKILGREDGFGLYQRYQRYELQCPSFLKTKKVGFLKKKECVDVSFLNVWDKQKILSYLALWNKRVGDHAHDEYQQYGFCHLVGDRYFSPLDAQMRSLDGLPLGAVWRQYFEQDHLGQDEIFQLYFVLNSVKYSYDSIFPPEMRLTYLTEEDINQWEYYRHIQCMIIYYFYERSQNNAFLNKTAQTIELFLKYAKANIYTMRDLSGNILLHSLADITPFVMMVRELRLDTMDDNLFRTYFPLVYQCYLHFNLDCEPKAVNKMNLEPLTAARACLLDILPQSALMEMILDTHTDKVITSHYYYENSNMLYEAFSAAYFEKRGVYGKPHLELPKENAESCRYLRETLDKINDTLIQMETSRLNEKSCITEEVERLAVVRGVKYLLIALKILEGEDIKRASFEQDRQTVFGNLIRRCYPLPTDSAEELKKAKISEKRLVETAMIAPQWIDFINEALEWDGFKEACYYFIAHMKQDHSEQKKAEIAHYTDLDPADLNDGAFDMEWCRTIYKKLGEKRIKVLYDAAKLLCDNNFHIRARKYMDACMGKCSKEEYLKQASEKRNKDALNAYCIVPIEDEKDLMERYLYVQQFLKESKAFGAQRQASEKRSCEIALMNLARNAHFDTADRLILRMESEAANQYRDVFEPKTVEDVELFIAADENGQTDICIFRNGKKLKNIPARLKHHEYVIRLKDAHTHLKQQYQRTCSMLEKAMEERTEYSCEEIETMANHIAAGPIIRRLVMICNGFIGFYQDGCLVMGDKKEKCTGTIRIAHAFDLYHHQVLKKFQNYLFEEQIVQPFKQVFRELYLKLDEEEEQEYTKRYTGYQIQTRQAAGALKNRGWNVSYEDGLEKVYYKQDVVVHLFADADWFSPGDIEAPSIDYVEFSERKTGKPLQIRALDDVLFSEAMRDVDLAVSLAFVGGVDPVTSTSTIDLRKAIVLCTCQLMKLTNVQIEGNFVHIAGKYNDYSVHLGSGMVHQKAGSAVQMIPIWSGHRGKVYLPFLDEDPLTAQILSKVIMLAEDTAIKDPAILSQIKKDQLI